MYNDLDELNNENQSKDEMSGVKDSTANVMVTIRPTDIQDQMEIVDALQENGNVIIDLTNVECKIAQRIIDFVSGACYYGNGRIRMIDQNTFHVTRIGEENTIPEIMLKMMQQNISVLKEE